MNIRKFPRLTPDIDPFERVERTAAMYRRAYTAPPPPAAAPVAAVQPGTSMADQLLLQALQHFQAQLALDSHVQALVAQDAVLADIAQQADQQWRSRRPNRFNTGEVIDVEARDLPANPPGSTHGA